jgi:Cu+-exporting ATPase
VLRLAASLEQSSEHPLATAMVNEARLRHLSLPQARQFEAITGSGARGVVDGQDVAVGNAEWMRELGAETASLQEPAGRLRTEGASVVFVAMNRTFAGLIALTDTIKSSAPQAIDELHAAGLRIVMASGDGAAPVNAVARELSIDEAHGEVRPRDKMELVRRLQSEGRKVAMAGDGINDAPALAGADIGVAMGGGADVALTSAQVTLVKGDLRGIARARRLSQATVANMRQNLGFAFLYNALGVPIAAGVLYPFGGPLLSPMLAALAMSLSSVSVVTNALRLGQVKM